MTTVPHPTPARHAIAALYGTDDDTVQAWRQACAQVAAQLYGETPADERRAHALTLAQDGHVTLADDGSATVESRGRSYTVTPDGACHCPDAQYRGGPCKHALAVQICTGVAGGVRPPRAPLAPVPTAYEAAPQGGWPPTPHTAARWDVHEAPASACVKFRVGTMEMTYTCRGQTDAEVLPRLHEMLPTLQTLLDACEARAEERRVSREAARAAAAPAPAPTAPMPAPTAPSGPADMTALLHAALEQQHAQVQARMAGQGHTNGPTNGHASPDDQATGVCSLHQVPMEQKQNARGTFYGHWLADEHRHCNGRRNGRR